MPDPESLVICSNEELSDASCRYVARLSEVAIKERGLFAVAVSGGSMPKMLRGLLKQSPPPDFAKWRVFFADERCVPHSDAESSYKACNDHLFKDAGLSIDGGHVFAIAEKHIGDAAAAAKAYEAALRSVFGEAISPDNPPKFDCVLLGMGPDGHTASLFPGHSLLEEKSMIVAPITDSPKFPPSRITLTLPVLNNARSAVFIAGGAGKGEMLCRIFGEEGGVLPSGMIKSDGELRWFIDTAAAGDLPDDVKAKARKPE